MQIQHQQHADHGEFFLLSKTGEKLAELNYFFETPNRINANHTFVSETLRGQGVAEQLYQALSQFVRDNQLELNPTCSYIAKKWERDQNHAKKDRT